MSTELNGKRESLVAQARAALDEINKNTDESRSAELEARHDAIMADFDALEKQVAREERMAGIESRAEEARAANRPLNNGGEASGQENGKAVEYRDAFYKMLSVGGELSELSSEERSVLRAGVVNPTELRAQTVGTNSAGGYTVPTTLAGFIDKAMKAYGPMYSEDLCTTMNTSSGNPMKIPTLDDTSGTAYAHTEAAALTDDGSADVAIGQAALDAYVYDTKFLRFSMELTQDSIFNFESLLADLLGERMGRLANNKLTVGTGSSQPNGIVTASTAGKTAASTTAFTSDEIIDLFHSVDPAYRASPKARFMMSDTVLATVRKLKDGQGNYLWQMGNVQIGTPENILGKPVTVNQDMSAALTTGQKLILFGDFGKFYVRKVGSPILGVMRERFWPDLGIAGLIRFDSEIGQSAAIKHLKLA